MIHESTLHSTIRDIIDFPKPGIIFKDITPVLKDAKLCRSIVRELTENIAPEKPDALVCLDSRGFWFGLSVAMELGIPMIPVRKQGKLPYKTISQTYDLEYGTACVEMNEDALEPGWRVAIHDDLLATGGTANAAAQLIKRQGASVTGFHFLVELDFLEGRQVLQKHTANVQSLVVF